jgi:uncharacterized protein (DUF433 family)
MRPEHLHRIVVDPAICGGRPVIRGTTVWVSLIVESIAVGMTEAEVLLAYPMLTPEDVHAALAYAAKRKRERAVPMDEDTES